MENKVYKRGVLEKVKELKRKIWRASEGRADKRNLVRNKRPDRKLGNELDLRHKVSFSTTGMGDFINTLPESSQQVPTQGLWDQSRAQGRLGRTSLGRLGRAQRQKPSCTCSASPCPALPHADQRMGTNPIDVLESPRASNPQAN